VVGCQPLPVLVHPSPEVLLFQPRAHDDSLVERAKRLRAGDHGAPALGRRGRPR
ncbi:unnamed protein product, partial [Urochloa humidicola]